MAKDPEKVVLGLSGGVDSAVSAILLREAGYDVTGYYFSISGNDTPELREAAELAEQLGLNFIAEDVSREFESTVVKSFAEDYISGRTPNPCIICNPAIKFRHLIDTADRLGAKYIATGHYAGIERNGGKIFITRSRSEKKDQSYMLYRLDASVLERLILPLEQFQDKNDVRLMAAEKGLKNAEKVDSQEICFINPGDNYVDFIRRMGFEKKSGCFTDRNGRRLGDFDDIIKFTVGQRKGLGIALGKPVFVTGIDVDKCTVTLGDNEDLFTNSCVSVNNFFVNDDAAFWMDKPIFAKVRYAARPAAARFEIAGEEIKTFFEAPQRAVTPGQSVVFYSDDKVIGGGMIK